MKNLLVIFLLQISYSMFSQQLIDTTEIKSIRYEWNVNHKKVDTSLIEILTEYKSGIFKEEHKHVWTSPNKEFGYYHIYDSENTDRHLKSEFKFYITTMGDLFWRNYYDEFGNLDRTVKKVKKNDSIIEWSYEFKNNYKRKGKLNYKIDIEGNKNIYKYTFFGKIKQINQFNDTTLIKISEYNKGRLITEKFPTRKKYRLKYSYEYDNLGRMTKKDDHDHYFTKYTYGKVGILKTEKIYKRKYIVIEYEDYKYDDSGNLLSKKLFDKNNKLRNESYFTYQ